MGRIRLSPLREDLRVRAPRLGIQRRRRRRRAFRASRARSTRRCLARRAAAVFSEHSRAAQIDPALPHDRVQPPCLHRAVFVLVRGQEPGRLLLGLVRDADCAERARPPDERAVAREIPRIVERESALLDSEPCRDVLVSALDPTSRRRQWAFKFTTPLSRSQATNACTQWFAHEARPPELDHLRRRPDRRGSAGCFLAIALAFCSGCWIVLR